MVGEPKEFIFRINRDVRFSANKLPYKDNMSAAFSKTGRKVLDQRDLML